MDWNVAVYRIKREVRAHDNGYREVEISSDQIKVKLLQETKNTSMSWSSTSIESLHPITTQINKIQQNKIIKQFIKKNKNNVNATSEDIYREIVVILNATPLVIR